MAGSVLESAIQSSKREAFFQVPQVRFLGQMVRCYRGLRRALRPRGGALRSGGRFPYYFLMIRSQVRRLPDLFAFHTLPPPS